MWCGQRVCFIQKLIQNGLINIKQCRTAVQTADIETKALSRVLFENFTDQLLGDKHVGDRWFIIRPFLSHVCLLSSLIWFARVQGFLFSCPCLAFCMVAHCRPFGFWARGGMCIALATTIICYFWVYFLHMLFAHTSHILDHDDDMSEGGCQSQTVTLACVTTLASRASCRR